MPKITALSTASPMASLTRGVTSPMMSKSASLTTASGMGTMTASSPASIYTLSHACWLVCLYPVSPFTQYAIGSMDRTGTRVWLLVILGKRLPSCITTEFFGVSCMISLTTC